MAEQFPRLKKVALILYFVLVLLLLRVIDPLGGDSITSMSTSKRTAGPG